MVPAHAGLVRGALGLYEASAVKKLGIPTSRQAGASGLLCHAPTRAVHHPWDYLTACSAALEWRYPLLLLACCCLPAAAREVDDASAVPAACRSGHGQLLGAYRHLRHQPAARSTPTALEAAAAASHNAAAVAAYNAVKPAPPAPTLAAATAEKLAARQQEALQDPATTPAAAAAAAAVAVAGQAAGASKHARRRQRKKQAQAVLPSLSPASSPAGAGAASASASTAAAAGAAAARDVPEERKLKKARSLGSLGEHMLPAGRRCCCPSF